MLVLVLVPAPERSGESGAEEPFVNDSCCRADDASRRRRRDENEWEEEDGSAVEGGGPRLSSR